MANETVFELKRGASGAAFYVILKDVNGAVNLTGYLEVKFFARQRGRANAIDGALCAIDGNQVTFKGRVRYEFDATTAGIPAGEYDVEFHGKDASGDLHIFPTTSAEPYGKLIVLPSL